MRLCRSWAVLSLCTVSACATDGSGDDTGDGSDEVVLGEPIEAEPGTWTFVHFPDAFCEDGSTTGVGVNPGTSEKLLVFLNGGGACWDYTTCYSLQTATPGPFGESEVSQLSHQLGGTIFDREDPNNPFADWSYVFVPYCTGDLHGGDLVATYEYNGDSRQYHHVGHKNILAYLARLGATWPEPDQLVVSGASAGGGGVLLNYQDFRRYWPESDVSLLDDSLPLFQGNAIQPWMREQWADAWHLQPLMDGVCPDCIDDFSLVHSELAKRYPDDPMALLSSTRDGTISNYYLLGGELYEAELLALDENVLAPNGWKTFFVPGSSHTMVGDPKDYESDDVPLWTWLTQMVEKDAAWKSVGP